MSLLEASDGEEVGMSAVSVESGAAETAPYGGSIDAIGGIAASFVMRTVNHLTEGAPGSHAVRTVLYSWRGSVRNNTGRGFDAQQMAHRRGLDRGVGRGRRADL